MKKLSALLLIGLVSFSLTGCVKLTDPEDMKTSEVKQEKQEVKQEPTETTEDTSADEQKELQEKLSSEQSLSFAGKVNNVNRRNRRSNRIKTKPLGTKPRGSGALLMNITCRNSIVSSEQQESNEVQYENRKAA